MFILITGSRKGIGKFISEKFLSRGHTVIGCSRGNSEINHKNYDHFICDVTEESSVVKMVRDIGKKYGRIDALINNAGIASMNHILSTPTSTLKKILHTNVIGSILLSREVSKLMIRKKTKGRIINFTTVASALSLEGEAIYASSKAAVQKFTQIAAKEFAPFGITVNCIGPNPIKTDLIKAVPNDKIRTLLQSQAIKRLGNENDVLNIVDFLISQSSNFITAQTIYLGGVHD